MAGSGGSPAVSTPGGPARRLVRSGGGALLSVVPELTPRARKLFWRAIYELVSSRRRERAPMLLNYGYASTYGPDEPDTGDDRFGRQLYAAVVADADLAGKDVLEIGCGRGGGSAFVFEHFAPRSLTGVDLARMAIDNCARRYSRPGLEFVTGDAEALAFPDATFDAVISVESSHCFPDVRRFLGQVRRVLRPGGLLLLADFRRSDPPPGSDEVTAFREQLAETGFRTLQERDITPNVLRALELNTPRIRARVERRVPKALRNYALEFAGVEGSAMYRAFAGGAMTYLSFVLERS